MNSKKTKHSKRATLWQSGVQTLRVWFRREATLTRAPAPLRAHPPRPGPGPPAPLFPKSILAGSTCRAHEGTPANRQT